MSKRTPSAKAQASNVSLAVAVTTPVPEVLKALNAKIASLAHISDTMYKTSGDLGIPGTTNIKNETKIPNLIKALSSIRGREKAYQEAAAELGLTTYEVFSVGGGNADQWAEDIKLRINIINHKDTLDQLNDIKKQYEGFLSTEDQKAILLEKLAGILA